MEVSLSNASNGMTATVVREFTPSRIERQLLAQVFELVCGRRGESEEIPVRGPMSLQPNRVGHVEQTIETHVAGRRAA